ncbi:hypothetical protein ACTMTF_41695 [Nonomuraea sp. ZG12]|uniref:hypothetical protein n=1 Tax=Nonomuraea sp. ZG12 TaxID=3452207 RepID=UPI003F88A5A2
MGGAGRDRPKSRSAASDRPAGPEPQAATEPVRVQRRVSSRGRLSIAGQRIRVGIGHAGATVTIEDTDGTFRITHAGQLIAIAEVARTTTKPIARFKVRKPQHTNGRSHRAGRTAFMDPQNVSADDRAGHECRGAGVPSTP